MEYKNFKVNCNKIYRYLYKRLCDYNLFVPDANWYADDTDKMIDQAEQTKLQKYATWLYVFLFVVGVYDLFTWTYLSSQTHTITGMDITLSSIDQLRRDHYQTLSCPCTTTNIPHKTFVSTSARFHPICSSDFISRSWIEALYLDHRSVFFVTDFRTTAFAQFELLASFCAIAKDIVSDTINEINQMKFITTQLLDEANVKAEVTANVENIQTMAPIQIISILSLVQVMYQSNGLVSALGTNAYITYTRFAPFIYSTMYWDGNEHRFEKNCLDTISIAPAAFYEEKNEAIMYRRVYWPFDPLNQTTRIMYESIDGFYGACLPLDAVLAATLDCLYNIQCLQVWLHYFPKLNQFDLQRISNLSSSTTEWMSIRDYIEQLFVEQWSTEVNYTNYFERCAPQQCTYSVTDMSNFSFAIATLLGLYGGLTAILRFFSSTLISIVLTMNGPNRCVQSKEKLIMKMKRLNLFKSTARRTLREIQQQRLATYTFLILFAGSIFILFLFNTLKNQTITRTINRPSLLTYRTLHSLYSDTLRCPCSQTTVPYSKFVSPAPIFHQVCSSDLISDEWISLLVKMRFSESVSVDWLTASSQYFRYLSALCQLANRTANDGIRRFVTRTIVTSNVLSEATLSALLNLTTNRLIDSLINGFHLFMDTSNSMIQVDQPLVQNFYGNLYDYNGLQYGTIDQGQQSPHVRFTLNRLTNYNTETGICLCSIDSSCHDSIHFVPTDFDTMLDVELIAKLFSYSAPGIVKGCFKIDEIRLSTLECFYEKTECFQNLIDAVNITYLYFTGLVPQYTPRPLVNDSAKTIFQPETHLSDIIDAMMINRWNFSFSFDEYYQTCQPSYCTYLEISQETSPINIIISLVSLIGGLSITLRILTQLSVKLLFRILRPTTDRSNEIRGSIFYRILRVMKKIKHVLFTKSSQLNIFPTRLFPNHLSPDITIHLGRLSTRLYFFFLIIAVIGLAFHILLRPQTLIKIFPKPSFEFYQQLFDTHGGENLQCPCSLISSSYSEYISIEPIFHQVCSSTFTNDQWRRNLTENFLLNIISYALTDYRRFLSAHLLFLIHLCQLSIRSVNYFLNQFLSSLLVTNQLLSESSFKQHVNASLHQSHTNAPTMLTRPLFMIRSASHANAIVSTYGTNYDYIGSRNDNFYYNYYGRALIYENNCSCGLNMSCTIPASLIVDGFTRRVPINGFKMGCTPSESLLASTLECLYNTSCIHLILETPTMMTPTPLNIIGSRFSPTTSISDLVNELFVERWLTNISYFSYYNRCSPMSCSYTYRQELDSLYTVTYLLGLCGGLNILSKWICPRIVYLFMKGFRWYRRHRIAMISV